MKDINEALNRNRDRIAYANKNVPKMPDTRPRNEEKREAVLLLELMQIVGNRSKHRFEKLTEEELRVWKK
ncbi:hypothetical protein [Cohnella sp. 56]|uniref:hypothetical protein n=1 Tax=Cohnella sp. 56 TaxID=3113722 RepID=UPI0030E7D4AE